MNRQPEQPPVSEGPLYIRWGQERAPFAVELRFDLVSRIKEELARADENGVEIGGLLIGAVPAGLSPTIRIDDIDIIRRRPEDGPIYTIDPRQHGRFAEVRRRAQGRDRTAIGFFRSHLRPGLLRPAIADRTLLSNEFKDGIYVLLLIEAKQPHSAAFFIATHGELPTEPSAQEFRFDAAEFQNLPEIEPQNVPPPPLKSKDKMRRAPWGTISAILLIGVCACFAIWYLAGGPEPAFLQPSSKGLELAVTDQGNLLRISWNHAAHELTQTSGATLTINDGGKEHEVKLGMDELRLGSVEYEKGGNRVAVTITLKSPGLPSASQSVQWP